MRLVCKRLIGPSLRAGTYMFRLADPDGDRWRSNRTGVHLSRSRFEQLRRKGAIMSTAQRGFASMDRGKQREIASKGGKAAHARGTAHEWTREEARAAGRKGGLVAHRRGRATAAPVRPQSGDVLISTSLATVDYDISIVPDAPLITCANHDQAVTKGRELAEQSGVDAWLTEDRSHFLHIAAYRSAQARRAAMPPREEDTRES